MGTLDSSETVLDSPFPEGWVTGDASDIGTVNEAIQSSAAPDNTEVPMMEEPPDTLVRLPGGFLHEGEVYREATVRELNGEDEEYLARALMGNNAVRYLQTLLERGVVSIGPVKVDTKVLDSLLVGDRETLMLGVRRATYGDAFDMKVTCPGCAILADIKVSLQDDVTIKPLNWPPFEATQTVALAAGKAVVRLASGADWRHLNGLENKTMAELNTILFTRCVASLNDLPFSTADSKRLSVKDRKTLIDWLADNQPGPEYDKVTWTCDACSKEVPLDISAADLFPR